MIDAQAKMESFIRSMDESDRTTMHIGLPALLCTAGVWFRGRTSSNDFDCTKRWRTRRRPKARDCFYNAQTFCMERDEGRYFEGYVLALPTLDPVQHAWVVMPDGKVIDFTLEAMERIARQKKIPCDTRRALYLGLEIPTDYIWETMVFNERYDSLAEEYFANERLHSTTKLSRD
jgi:hypothetical protein